MHPEVACYSNVAQCLLKLSETAPYLFQATKLYQSALEACDKAVADLKTAIATSATLHWPDYEKPF